MQKTLVIATYDSFVRVGIKLAKRLGSEVDVAIQHVKNNQLSLRQIRECELDHYHSLDYRDMTDDDFDDYDLVIVSLGNAASRTFAKRFLRIYEGKAQRPITISIFPGVIFGHTESILARIHFDIILANSEYDKGIVQELIDLYDLPTKVINYGLINIESGRKFEKVGKDIFFIDQVKIPESKQERKFVLDKLIELAEKRADYNVFLKTRVVNKELTVHQDKNSYVNLLSEYKSLPKNFYIFDGNIDDAYSKMGVCLSFSSSVLIEALYYKIPSFVPIDLGISEKLYNYPFMGSNILIHFSDILEKGHVDYQVSSGWYDQHVHFDDRRDVYLKKMIGDVRNSNKVITIPELLFGGGFRFGHQKGSVFMRKFKKLISSPRLFLVDSKLFKLLGRKNAN